MLFTGGERERERYLGVVIREEGIELGVEEFHLISPIFLNDASFYFV